MPQSPPHRPTILIVDDEPFNVDLLEQELEDIGCRTVAARNGQQALDSAAAERPDLILLDVMMPVMDGFEACRRLKDSEHTQLIPVIIMTALDGIDDRVRGIEAGADDFLTKPVNPRELRARIQTALRRKRVVDSRLTELSRIRDHFAKFVPESVKRIVAQSPEAPSLEKTERDVSVMFCDLSGYARLSETLLPDALNALVESYFSAFLDAVQEEGGDINETAGDGFMAIFEAPDPHAHALAATKVALSLLDRTERLNLERPDCPLAIHMGLNSGSALVGSTRFDGLRGSRWTFTASGPVTNLAARLAGIAQPGQLLAGPETVKRLGGRHRADLLGRERLKNLSEAIEVYCIARSG
jgi:DNA-binding response OmpR family regulator